MGIKFYEEERVFKLDTCKSSYLIGIADEEKFVGHIYYGKTIGDWDLQNLLKMEEYPFAPSKNNGERLGFYNFFPMEYSTHGIGDYRESCIEVKTVEGTNAAKLTYKAHEIYDSKPALLGLPSTFSQDTSVTTLDIVTEDQILGLEVILRYSIFADSEAIVRSVFVKNNSRKEIYLNKVLTACMDMDNREFEVLTLHGAWARERKLQRNPIVYGRQNVASVKGESSHQESPFMALVTKGTNQTVGEVYAMNFVYSGNFLGQVELSQFDSVRMVMGIHPTDFYWKLEAGQGFQAPEVVLVYSSRGLDGMTHTFHDLYRNHLIRGKYKDIRRPVLINNWEATYFDFDTEKLLAIAKEASAHRIEMLVMDDGWFGKRNDDKSGLGDWIVNENKLKGGFNPLVSGVNDLNMEFGIWLEPEMVCPDSDLYRAHPDWAIQIPGREATLARYQYVLDYSRQEVLEYLWENIKKVLQSANITYVKWDMNRYLCDLYSAALPAERQGELSHRFMLGVYELQERLVTEFPHILLENCSSGGRFDPGMLYYSPQIWTSDDTDGVERLGIQEGTALVYPLSSMGAHISDCPNHQLGRSVPFETRGYIAMAGTFGYELDITKISPEERDMIPKQVEAYHKYSDLIRRGDYYRIASYQENHFYDCWQVVSKDKEEVLLTFIQVLNRPNYHGRIICFRGLDEHKAYQISYNGNVYNGKILKGSTLMNAGILLENLYTDFAGIQIYLHVVGKPDIVSCDQRMNVEKMLSM